MKNIRSSILLAALATLVACSGDSTYKKTDAGDGDTQALVIPERFESGNYTPITPDTGDYSGLWLFTQSGRSSSNGSSSDNFRRGLVYINEDSGNYTIQDCSADEAAAVTMVDDTVTFVLYEADVSLAITDENHMSGSSVAGTLQLDTAFVKLYALGADPLGSFTFVHDGDSINEVFDIRCFTEILQIVSGDSAYQRSTITLGDIQRPDYGFITMGELEFESGASSSFISFNGQSGLDTYSYSDNSSAVITKTLVSESDIQVIGSTNEFSSAVTVSF